MTTGGDGRPPVRRWQAAAVDRVVVFSMAEPARPGAPTTRTPAHLRLAHVATIAANSCSAGIFAGPDDLRRAGPRCAPGDRGNAQEGETPPRRPSAHPLQMTQHDIRAGLYAPLTVLVYETGPSTVRVEFDRPSSLFGQFENPAATRVATELDTKLCKAIETAASEWTGHRPQDPAPG
jgi:hypothetical protein